MATVSGNLGGSAGSGGAVTLIPKHSSLGPATSVVCNGSGDFSFTGVGNGRYVITASLAGFAIRSTRDVTVFNNTDVTAVNFSIAGLNQSNS